MGVNSDPITLHKYLYANADPVTYVDPTGNFSIASTMRAVNVVSTLVGTAQTVNDVFQIATGEEELSAKQIGSALVFNMLGNKAVKFVGLFGKKFADKFKKSSGKPGCFQNSFVANTRINSEFGLVPIETLKIGDKVYSYNEETKQVELKEITNLIRHIETEDLLELVLSNGETFSVTQEHPFYTNGIWTSALMLPVGEKLLSLDKETLYLESKSYIENNIFVYNFTVEGNHNYFIGQDSTLVHNASKKCGRTPETEIRANSYEDARNKALNQIGVVDHATRRPVLSKSLGNSKIPKGTVVGFETNVNGVWKQYRIDYDADGPHINIKVGKGNAMVTNFRISFPGKESDIVNFAKVLSR